MSSGADIEPVSDLTERSDNRKAAEAAERLRLAVSRAGGLAHVGAISGVPTRTLSRYLSGQEMKVQSLAAIADACGVSIEWLATGRGTMTRVETPPSHPPEPSTAAPSQPSAPPPPGMPSDLFNSIDINKLVGCIEAAQDEFARRNRTPSLRRVMQVALVLYDALAAEEAETAAITGVVTALDTTLET